VEIAFPFYWAPGSSRAKPGKREIVDTTVFMVLNEGRWIVSTMYGVPGEPMSDIHANNIQHSKKMNVVVEW
jgi:hypothetical protein